MVVSAQTFGVYPKEDAPNFRGGSKGQHKAISHKATGPEKLGFYKGSLKLYKTEDKVPNRATKKNQTKHLSALV